MKYFLIVIGSILILIGLAKMSMYILDYQQLTTYGKGYIWGNILLVIVGGGTIYLGFKRDTSKTS